MQGRVLQGLKKKARSIVVRRTGKDAAINKPTKARRPGRRFQLERHPPAAGGRPAARPATIFLSSASTLLMMPAGR